MEKQALLEQAKQLVLLQPGLSITDTAEGLTISGTYLLNSSYNDIPLYDEYQVKIIVPWEFPTAIPSIWEVGGKVPRESTFGHFLDNGELCLGANCDLISCLIEEPTVSHYVCSLLESYFYSVSYYIEYGVMPDFGERSHGVYGLIEAYKERYGVSDDNLLIDLLFYLIKRTPYRGHIQCPCHSGRKLRQCHGPKVLQDLNSEYYMWFYKDAIAILYHFYEERYPKE